MADTKLEGLGVALVTPFKEDFSIDYSGLERLIEHVIEGGCDYIVALGTTAETPTLSREEKNALTQFIKEKVSGRLPLVIGIGGNNTYGVIEEIRSRDLTGYEAILSVVPYYNKPTQEGLYQHFRTISEASPIPILLYNVPGRTGVNLTAKTTIKIYRDSKNIIGIKEASGNISQSEEIIKGTDNNFKLISGNDSDTFSLMDLGARGVISVLANAYPKEVKKLVTLCQNKETTEAKNYQESLQTLIKNLFIDGNPAGVKALLSQMNIVKNILRLPLVPVSKEIEKELIKSTAFLF